ncbi:AAA family ATPase [Polaromonas sp. JS666]|uniref:AAA family ATPase n=1 Tax=Polaromonas sp. (strain JS666 / ATCC BAA-500) TaxID=296591 RepID=UPI00005318C5|nr:ATP-binding protein [Polaromonas sp. JS666]ABE45652.1 prophage MuSo1, DNA transposition protein, putative [Polaromonas sp. JS666]
MRQKLAGVKNVAALQAAFETLSNRDAGIPGMGLVHGFTGAGKTTAISWLVNRTNGVYARAYGTWTPNSMLGSIMHELGAAPLQRSAQMLKYITGDLERTNRPLFIDEANYFAGDTAMLDTLRDIHDVSNVPVILIGHEGTERKLIHRAQLARRISEWVEFKPLDAEDARILADTVAEVAIADDLLAELHAHAKGSMGLMTVGLARVEAMAKANGWKRVDADQWAGRAFFLGNAPKSTNGRG